MVCTHYMVSLLLSDGKVLNEAVHYLSPPNAKKVLIRLWTKCCPEAFTNIRYYNPSNVFARTRLV